MKNFNKYNIKKGDFKIEINTRLADEKRDLIIVDREFREKQGIRWKYYKCKCNVCNHVWTAVESSLLTQVTGCPCCRGITVVSGVNDISTTAPWMTKFFKYPDEANLYTKVSGKKITVICPDCGREKEGVCISNLYRRRSIACPCSDSFSYAHKYTYCLLEQIGLDFVTNISFDWCKFYNPYKEKDAIGYYDFVITSSKIIIEVDGGFHRSHNNRSGQTKEESELLDSEKDRLARENGYTVIRVVYNDDLQMKDKIFKYGIGKLLDTSLVDWEKCDSFALSNLVKEVCNVKRNNPRMAIMELGKMFKISTATVTNYLKKGSSLGWCIYYTTKKVEIFKDDISLGVFDSAYELQRQSEDLFNVKFNNSNIASVCNGKRKTHKGYTFKYVY